MLGEWRRSTHSEDPNLGTCCTCIRYRAKQGRMSPKFRAAGCVPRGDYTRVCSGGGVAIKRYVQDSRPGDYCMGALRGPATTLERVPHRRAVVDFALAYAAQARFQSKASAAVKPPENRRQSGAEPRRVVATPGGRWQTGQCPQVN